MQPSKLSVLHKQVRQPNYMTLKNNLNIRIQKPTKSSVTSESN